MSALARLRRVIASVPRGKVITYGQVASAAGFPRAARLTVRALHSQEGLPWHRVVGAGGRIALPGEEGQEQRLRLKIEGVTFRAGRVRMELHAWVPNSIPRRRRRTGPPEGPSARAAGRRKAHAR
jgi:methylated-DNA-protein-cysteine methyltransferase related protein